MSGTMTTWVIVAMLVAAGIAAAARIISGFRKLRGAPGQDDWDARLIERLRAQGQDPFKPHEADFFFALPSEQACQAVNAALEGEGFAVDIKAAPENGELPFSLHARKSLRLTVLGMQELRQRFRALAELNGGRYDGWAADVVR